MPLIKGSSRKAISENIKTEMKSKPRDQAIAIALDVARRAKRASGGGVDEDDMPSLPTVSDPTDRVLSGEVLEPINSRERNRVARKAMYGREPILTPEDRAEIGARLPAYEDTARNAERVLPELFNVPRTIESGVKAYEDPSLANVTSFGVNAALTAARPTAAAGIGMAGLAEGLRRDYMPSFFGSAEAQSDDPLSPEQRKRYNRLSKLRDPTPGQMEELRTLSAIISSAGIAKATSGTRTEEDRRMREQAQYDAKVRSALDKSAAALARDKRFADTDTGKVFNSLGPLAPAVAAAPLGLASRFVTGGGSVMKDYVVPGALGTLSGAAAAHWPMAYDANYSPTYNPKREALEILSTDLPEGHPEQVRSTKILSGPNAPEKRNPVQAEAEKLLYDPTKFLERTALGVAEGVGGGLFGADIARVPGRVVDGVASLPSRIARIHAEGMESANEARLRALNVARDVQKSRAASAGELSSAADESRQIADATRTGAGARQLADEAAELEAGAGTGRPGSPAGASAGRSETDRLMDDIRDLTQGRVPRSGASSNQVLPETSPTPPSTGPNKGIKAITNDGPKPIKSPSLSPKMMSDLRSGFHAALKTDDLADITLDSLRLSGNLPKGKWSPEQVELAKQALDDWRRSYRQLSERHQIDPATIANIIENAPKRASGGEVEAREHHSHFQPRKVGRFAGGPVYHGAKDSPKLERRARGVDVDAALETARRYAHGGAVHAGPVPGETTGRSDELPMDVEAGSYVVPADIVSALGDGNSEAGYRHLDKVFGQGRPRLARGGAAVPIKISHGEYVVPPETVARIGKGDMDMGHRTLDKFVLGVRKQNIHKLSKLPPPAR